VFVHARRFGRDVQASEATVSNGQHAHVLMRMLRPMLLHIMVATTGIPCITFATSKLDPHGVSTWLRAQGSDLRGGATLGSCFLR
jgi:hypothetical protein